MFICSKRFFSSLQVTSHSFTEHLLGLRLWYFHPHLTESLLQGRWRILVLSEGCSGAQWPLSPCQDCWRRYRIGTLPAGPVHSDISSLRPCAQCLGDWSCSKERARKCSCRTQGAVPLSGSAPGTEEPLWVSLNTWN